MNDITWAITINISIATFVVVGTQFLLRIDRRFFDLGLTCSEYEKTSGGGRLENYFDTDQALMCDPKIIDRVLKFIVGIFKKYPTENICFVEKDSGSIGALILSGLISSMTKRSTSTIRMRRDVQSMSVKGAMLASGDKIILIQELLQRGFKWY